MLTQTFFLKAMAKQRPRLGRGGVVYTPKETVLFEKTLSRLARWQFKISSKAIFGIEENIGVNLVFTFKRPKKTKLKTPRGDLDNFVKSSLDALNKVLFDDDRQVSLLVAKKQFGEKDSIKISIWGLR